MEFIAILAIVPILMISIGSLLSASLYKGLVSDHFNDKVFQHMLMELRPKDRVG